MSTGFLRTRSAGPNSRTLPLDWLELQAGKVQDINANMTLDLSREDLDRLLAALDSHIYWQLSDQHYRNNADVLEPGSDDPDQAAEVAACSELVDRLTTQR